MEKKKTYYNTKFGAEILQAAVRELAAAAPAEAEDVRLLQVETNGSTWTHESIEEFYADYRTCGPGFVDFFIKRGELRFRVIAEQGRVTAFVAGPDRGTIERIFNVLENGLAVSRIPEPVVPHRQTTVFIGHGRSEAWRDLKDHLHDKHGYQVEAYETGARAGHSIRDILEEMIAKSSFAVLVMTAEDEQSDGAMRTRQNVVHEAGLFQGRLGFARAIMLLEEGVEQFSNVHGVQYVPFAQGRIRETFGEVLATLSREFGASPDRAMRT